MNYAAERRTTRFELRFLVPGIPFFFNTENFIMSVATKSPSEIQAFTSDDFTAPETFTNFCSNRGRPLHGMIGGESVAGSMNATIDVINPATKEVFSYEPYYLR